MGKIALVLSGGGFRGAFQAGALQVIKENWKSISPDRAEPSFDIVSGVSVGALNGLLTAENKLDDLMGIWQEIAEKGMGVIYNSDFIDTHLDEDTDNPKLKFNLTWDTIKKYFPKTTGNLLLKLLFSRKSLFTSAAREFQFIRALGDNSPLLEKIKKYARRDLLQSCIFRCGFVSLDTGDYYSVGACDYETDEDFARGVLASTAIPIIWPPVDRIKTNKGILRQCGDGGIKNVSPLRYVIEEIKNDPRPEDYTIVIINCSTGKIANDNYRHKSLSQIALRSLNDIAITEIFNNDIRDFVTKNFIVKQIREDHPDQVVHDFDFEKNQPGKPLQYFKSIVIQPDHDVLGDPLTANARQIRLRIEHGREKARTALKLFHGSEQGNKTTIV